MTVFGSILLLLGIRFLDVAPEAGLDFRHHSGSPEKKYILETIGGGVAWIDYDRDGWPDLYLVNGGKWDELLGGTRSVSNALFRNNGDSTFTDVTAGAGLNSPSLGHGSRGRATWTTTDGPTSTCATLVPTSSTETTATAPSPTSPPAAAPRIPAGVRRPAFSDYDGDGWIDLYVANYVEFRSPFTSSRPSATTGGSRSTAAPRRWLPLPTHSFATAGTGPFPR